MWPLSRGRGFARANPDRVARGILRTRTCFLPIRDRGQSKASLAPARADLASADLASWTRRGLSQAPAARHCQNTKYCGLNSSMLLLAGGLTGFKKCTSTCIQTFAVASLISITWLMFGYSLAFGHNWDGTKNEFIGGANMFWFWGDGKGIPSFPACQPAKSSFACQSVTLHYRLSSIADGALRHAYAVSHQLECLRCGSSTLCASTTCNTYGPYTTSLAKTDTTRLKPNSQLGTIPTSVHIM